MFGKPTTFRLLAVAAALSTGLLITAGPASAHVEVDDGSQPAKGGYGIVRLIVPTESDTASTLGVSLTLPKGVDLPEARTLPVPGWTATVETQNERVSRITWKAVDKAGGIKPSEFGEFAFSAGPWPENVDTVSLPTEQTYSDGTVVAWNEVAVDKDSEPEHPAPTVTLAAAGAGHDHADGDHSSATSVAASPESHHEETGTETSQAAAEVSSDGNSWPWRIATLVSLVVALGTAAALAVVLRRTRGTGS
jgi:uncharacterized protein YcnI